MLPKPKPASSPNNNVFSDMAPQWWDERGPFGPLHRMNPVRMEYILKHAGNLRGRDVLDVGCGGGLLAEPMARLGARVMGIDESSVAVEVAQAHAAGEGLVIDYQCTRLEKLLEKRAGQKKRFDIVTASEVIEHVDDAPQFLKEISAVLKPDGILIITTLNRTIKSLALGIVLAEFVLDLVPRGTHKWSKFVKPSELMMWGQDAGLELEDITGVHYNPLTRDFSLTPEDVGINYMAALEKTS